MSARSSTNALRSRCCSAQFGGDLGSSSSRGCGSSRSRSSSRSRRNNSSSPDRNSSARRIQVELAQRNKIFNKYEREVLLLLLSGMVYPIIVVVCLHALARCSSVSAKRTIIDEESQKSSPQQFQLEQPSLEKKEHLTSHGRAQDRSCSSCSRQSCRVGKQKRLHNNALWMTELTISNTCFGLGGLLVVLARA